MTPERARELAEELEGDWPHYGRFPSTFRWRDWAKVKGAIAALLRYADTEGTK